MYLLIGMSSSFKELKRENVKLKRLATVLSLEKQILKDVASGNF